MSVSIIEGLHYSMDRDQAAAVLAELPREQAAALAVTWRQVAAALEALQDSSLTLGPKPPCIRAAEARAVPPPPVAVEPAPPPE